MNLLTCINDNYVHPLINLLFSIRRHCKKRINLFVLTTKLSDENVKLISDKMKEIGVNVTIQTVELKKYSLSNSQHFSLDMFLRILAFDLLPAEIDKILYVDVDMISLKDITPLYETNIKGKLIAAVRDFGVKFKKVNKYVNSLNLTHTYFNSGMLLMNLDKMREMWARDELQKYIEENSKTFSCPDQDVLNTICNNKDIVFIDDIYNYQIKNNEKLINDEVVLLHFVGYTKPWNHYLLHKHEKLFWEYYDKTGLTEYRKKRKSFAINRIKLILNKVKNKLGKMFHLKG